MSEPSEVSKKEMQSWVEEHSCHAPRHQAAEDAILRLIEKAREWKKLQRKAKRLIDDGLFDGAQGRWSAARFIEQIRDFEKRKE